MPIYEYQCRACGHRLESLEKIGDAPLTDCPECHRSTLEKLISAAGFQLKGSGWYATDFKNKKESTTHKKSETSTTTTDTTEKKSESSSSTDTAA